MLTDCIWRRACVPALSAYNVLRFPDLLSSSLLSITNIVTKQTSTHNNAGWLSDYAAAAGACNTDVCAPEALQIRDSFKTNFPTFQFCSLLRFFYVWKICEVSDNNRKLFLLLLMMWRHTLLLFRRRTDSEESCCCFTSIARPIGRDFVWVSDAHHSSRHRFVNNCIFSFPVILFGMRVCLRCLQNSHTKTPTSRACLADT